MYFVYLLFSFLIFFLIFCFFKKKQLYAYNMLSSLSNFTLNMLTDHCLKSVQIRSLFWSVFSCIRTEYRKIQTRKNSVFGNFPCSGYAYKKKVYCHFESALKTYSNDFQNINNQLICFLL